MKTFKIKSNDFLNQDILAFYHSDYYGGGRWKTPGTIENAICMLKNDITPYSNEIIIGAVTEIGRILYNDLPLVAQQIGVTNLTVCIVPRAKVNYRMDQLMFKSVVRHIVNKMDYLADGINFIQRIKDTKTTHLSRGFSGGGDGSMPYPGITKDTCSMSREIKGRNILLIDDLYTKTVGIDEDAIQALLDCGANSVFFYSIGHTQLGSPEPFTDSDLPF